MWGVIKIPMMIFKNCFHLGEWSLLTLDFTDFDFAGKISRESYRNREWSLNLTQWLQVSIVGRTCISNSQNQSIFILLTLPFSPLLPLVPHLPLLLPPPSPPPQRISCTKTSCVVVGNLKLKYLLSNFYILVQMSVDLLIPSNNLIWRFTGAVRTEGGIKVRWEQYLCYTFFLPFG